MFRLHLRAVALLAAADLVTANLAQAAEKSVQPLLYELVINGESFSIEANRTIKLESRKNPGLAYDVALRVAQVQRLVLNSLQIDYDRGFQVADDQGRTVRTATLRHELGFTLIASDLGRSYDAAGRQQALEALANSVQTSLRAEQAGEVKTTELPANQLPAATIHARRMRYTDKLGTARTSLIYILGDESFTAACIVQLLDTDAADVLPLVKTTLNSLRAK